jgi:hypothetical protein
MRQQLNESKIFRLSFFTMYMVKSFQISMSFKSMWEKCNQKKSMWENLHNIYPKIKDQTYEYLFKASKSLPHEPTLHCWLPI